MPLLNVTISSVGQITFQSETGVWELSSTLNFVSGSSYNYTDSIDRCWRYQLVYNENVLYLETKSVYT